MMRRLRHARIWSAACLKTFSPLASSGASRAVGGARASALHLQFALSVTLAGCTDMGIPKIKITTGL